jgi:hypothetical protein
MTRIIILIVLLFLGWYFFSGSNDDNVQMNVYYYRSSDLGNSLYLGQVKGLSNCQATANRTAQIENRRSDGWSYICCTIENGSACHRKLK